MTEAMGEGGGRGEVTTLTRQKFFRECGDFAGTQETRDFFSGKYDIFLGYCREKSKFDIFTRMSTEKSGAGSFKFPGGLKVIRCRSNNVCCHCKFSRSLMAQARSARAISEREKTRIRNLQYGPRKRG